MAKKFGKKSYIGKVMVGKPKLVDGKEVKENGKVVRNPDYIVIDMDFELRKGDFLKLESKAQRLKELQESLEAGRLKEDKYEELATKAQNSSDNVRFTIIHQEVSDE